LTGDPPGTRDVAQQPPTLGATAEIISLDREVERARLTVADEIALQDAVLRRWMARRIIWVFIGANVVTLLAMAGLALLDQSNVVSHSIGPGELCDQPS
jgi:hypothetical protein